MFSRKRIKTLCNLDGYSRRQNGIIDSLIIKHENTWYEAHESFVFDKVNLEDQRTLIEFWNALPAEYEVIDISSYETPW